MGSKTNYTLIGLSVLVLFTGALITFLWLSVGFDKVIYKTYTVYMNEPVTGLNIKSIVKFNGVDVGVVKQISLNKANPKQVVLLINVDEAVMVSKSTIAILQSQGLTGLSFLELQVTNGSVEPLVKVAGEPYPVIPSKPSLFLKLNKTLTEVTKSFNKMTSSISYILDKENATSIKNSLHNIDNFTSILSKQSKQISIMIKNLDVLIKNSSMASNQLPALINTVTRSGHAVTKMSNSVSKTMRGSARSLSQINNQTLPKANLLMNNLNSLTEKLNSLTKELKRNPAMLLRGKVQRKLGPGE